MMHVCKYCGAGFLTDFARGVFRDQPALADHYLTCLARRRLNEEARRKDLHIRAAQVAYARGLRPTPVKASR